MNAALKTSHFVIFSALLSLLFQASAQAEKAGHTIIPLGGNGQPFQMDLQPMVNHGTQSPDPISISLEGNGSYSSAAIAVVRDKDWFPGLPVVSHISFVCSENLAVVPPVPHVLFPTRKEVDSDMGARIELPCTMSAYQVRKAMERVQKFLLDQQAQPIETARKSRTLAQGCDRKPESSGCVQWKEITDLFTGNADRPLLAAASYCGVTYGGGVEENQWLKKKRSKALPIEKSGNGILGFIEPLSDEKYKAFLLNQKAIEDWKSYNIPSCAKMSSIGMMGVGMMGGGGMMTGGGMGMLNTGGFPGAFPSSPPLHLPSDPPNPKRCLGEMDKAKASLKARGIALEQSGRITYKGKDCTHIKELNCAIAVTAMHIEESAMRMQAMDGLDKPQPTPPQSDLDKIQELASEYVDDYVRMSESALGGGFPFRIHSDGSFHKSPPCGRDAKCWKLAMRIEGAFNAQTRKLRAGCYIVESTAPGGPDGAIFTFASVPTEDCARPLLNPFAR